MGLYYHKESFEVLSDYTVFDIKTTSFLPSDSKIIEISALRVRNNQIVADFSKLVNPHTKITSSASQTHHITDEMVSNAEEIETVLPQFIDFIGSDTLVGHNVINFGIQIVERESKGMLGKAIDNPVIDTWNISKIHFPNEKLYSLERLTDILNIDNSNIQTAEKDCTITHKLYQALKPYMNYRSKTAKIKRDNKKNKDFYAHFTENTVKYNCFKGKSCSLYGTFKLIDSDCIHDIFSILGAFNTDYFKYSSDFAILSQDMFEKYISCNPDDAINQIISSHQRVISEQQFIEYSGMIIDTMKNSTNFNLTIDVKDKNVVLTGEFDVVDKRDFLVNQLILLGANVKNKVTKTTDYLVIGNKGSEFYKDGKGNKLTDAERFNAEGANIKILTEKEFIKEC